MKRLMTFIVAISFSVFTFAQDYNIAMQVVASAGGYYNSTEAGVSLSWTLGEVAYTTLTEGDYMLTQGFQQGNLFTTDVEKPELAKSDIKVFPNPASVEFYIQVNSSTIKGNTIAEVFDLTGKRVMSKNLVLEDGTPCKMPIVELRSGIYMVKLTIEGGNTIRVFKLIKE